MNLCVIPVRGGSKRIPRKNIRDFCGKPMIAWSIAGAQESGLFEHIIVSTDDAAASIVESLGSEVPLRRLRFAKGNFPVAEVYYQRTISPPLHPRLSEAQQDEACLRLREAPP